jgi:hypothetical protein
VKGGHDSVFGTEAGLLRYPIARLPHQFLFIFKAKCSPESRKFPLQ